MWLFPEVTSSWSVHGHVHCIVKISAGQDWNVAARDRTCFPSIFAALFVLTAFP